MISKPLIIFDPFPRNEDMVYTADVKKELNEISNLVTHFGSRAPDHLIEKNLSEVAIIVGQTEMLKERLDKSPKLKAIINVNTGTAITIVPIVDKNRANIKVLIIIITSFYI